LIRGFRLHFTQILFENVTQEKIPNPSYSRCSRLRRPSVNPFGYVQLGNLKKPNKKYIVNRFTAQRKKQSFWVAPRGVSPKFEKIALLY